MIGLIGLFALFKVLISFDAFKLMLFSVTLSYSSILYKSWELTSFFNFYFKLEILSKNVSWDISLKVLSFGSILCIWFNTSFFGSNFSLMSIFSLDTFFAVFLFIDLL